MLCPFHPVVEAVMVAWHLHPASWSSGDQWLLRALGFLPRSALYLLLSPSEPPPAVNVSGSSLSPFSSHSLDFPTLGHGGCFWLQGCSPAGSWMGWRFRKQILESLLPLPSQGLALEVGPAAALPPLPGQLTTGSLTCPLVFLGSVVQLRGGVEAVEPSGPLCYWAVDSS